MEVALMNEIEKLLTEEKRQIDKITSPDQLEQRLRTALMSTSRRKNKWKPMLWKLATAAIFLIVVIGFNYNAFAYYGKKILGIDPVLSGTLQQLNEEGLGQTVDETITLENGSKFTVNGVMSDENQFIIFYTMKNPNGISEQQRDVYLRNITGFLTDSFAGGGMATFSEDETEYTGMLSFNPVSPFAKKLTLHIDEYLTGNDITTYEVTFDYNPNLAMQTELKQSIKKKVHVDQGTVTFDLIKATPTVTIIEGSLSVKNFDRIPIGLNGIELHANGEPLAMVGSGATSSFNEKTKFDIQYDALPKELDSLQLVFKQFVGYEEVHKRFNLQDTGNGPFTLYEHNQLWIKDVRTTSEGIEITIATDENILLDDVSIETDGKITPLKTTLAADYIVIDDDGSKINNEVAIAEHEDGRVLKERVILFETSQEPQYIIIGGIHYIKTFDEMIDIPVK